MPTSEFEMINLQDEASTRSVQSRSYDVNLHAPLFYGSKEGSVIETEPTVSATALMHAIGYEYFDLEKRFLLTGDAATTPAYERLRALPFFASEMRPRAVDATERTFRTTSYATERAITSQDVSVGEFLTGAKNPVPRRFEGSNAGWHKMREYVGLSPGSTFEFTIWAAQGVDLPDEMGLRLGIKRTGEVRATATDDDQESVALNQYLLAEVYSLDETQVSTILENARGFQRGNDVRTSRFVGVDKEWVDSGLAPTILPENAVD